MISKRTLATILLCVVMVTTAGCAGWGTDGPAQDPEASDGNTDTTNESSQTNTTSPTDTGDDVENSSGDTSSEPEDSAGGDSGATEGESTSDENTAEDGAEEPTTDSDSSSTCDPCEADDERTDADDDEYTDTVEETERTLTVTVVDAEGNPIEGASVHATGPVLSTGIAHEPSGETGEDGTVTLTAYDGEYGVEARYDGTTTDTKTVVVDGDTETTVELDSSPPEHEDGDESETDTGTDNESDSPDEPDTYSLTVEVIVGQENEPVAGLPVELVTYDGGEPVAEGTTGEDGTVTFEVPSGDYEILPDTSDSEYTDYGTHPVSVVESDEEYTLRLSHTPDEPANGEDDADDDSENENESENESEYDDPATGIVRVVDQDGEPVEGEEVILKPPGAVEPESYEHRTTDENGEVRIELLAGEPEDVVLFGVEVRGEEQTLGIMSDEHVGVQEVIFEVTTDGDDENEAAYADASALEIETYKHRGSEPFTDYDRLTLRNTDEERPLDVTGYQLDTSLRHGPQVIEDETVIPPGETVTIVLDAENKMLDSAGGVLTVYDDAGNAVIEDWAYMGSSSHPYMTLPEEDTGSADEPSGGENETGNESASAHS